MYRPKQATRYNYLVTSYDTQPVNKHHTNNSNNVNNNNVSNNNSTKSYICNATMLSYYMTPCQPLDCTDCDLYPILYISVL